MQAINFPADFVNLPLSSHRLALLLGALTAAIGCSGSSATVVTAGSALPSEAMPGDPFAALEDRTGLGGYEFGSCNDDRDCDPSGCGDGVCGPVGDSSLCANDFVSSCLGDVSEDLCGCVQGFCRWARQAPTLYCVAQGDDRASTLPFEGAPRELYPIRITD